MNYIDIIILILVLLASHRGFSRGLIKELIALISLVAGVYIATNFSVYFEEFLTENISQHEEFISVISFVLVFFIVFLSLKLAGVIISKLVKSLQLGLVNKLLGLFFAASKTLLILSFVLFELNHLSEQFGTIIPENQKSESFLYKKVIKIIPTISPVVKEKLDWKEEIKIKVDEVKESIKKKLDTIPVSL